jgi:hypothetical protein
MDLSAFTMFFSGLYIGTFSFLEEALAENLSILRKMGVMSKGPKKMF